MARFGEALGKLDELDRLCQRVLDGDSHELLGKYNKQAKVLASIRSELVDAQTAYNVALDRAIDARKALLVEMQDCSRELDGTKGQLEALLDPDDVGDKGDEIIAEAKDLLADAEKSFQPPHDAFAPSAPIRSSDDLRAAKIHNDDSTTRVVEHLTNLIQANKVNMALIKEVRELAVNIEKWVPSASRG